MPDDFETLNAPLFKQLDLLAKIGLGQALVAGGERIIDGSRLRTPVDKGNLYADQEVILMDEGGNGKGGGIEIRIGYNLEEITGRAYAAFVEFGTVKMAAQPFLRPALDEDMPAAYAKIAAEVVKLIGQKIGAR